MFETRQPTPQTPHASHVMSCARAGYEARAPIAPGMRECQADGLAFVNLCIVYMYVGAYDESSVWYLCRRIDGGK